MATPPKPEHRNILLKCQSMLVDFCQLQADAFLSIAAEYLFSNADKTRVNDSQRRYLEARQAILDQQAAFKSRIANAIAERFELIQAGKEQTVGTRDNTEDSLLDQPLGLVGNDDMELQVAFTSMCTRTEADNVEQLFALGQRTALLNHGSKVDDAQNPYAPKLFCEVMRATIEDINHEPVLDTSTQLIVLKLFERHFMRHLSTIYQRINDELVASNILPNLRYGGVRKQSLQPRRRKSDTLGADSESRQQELGAAIEELLQTTPQQLNPGLPVIPVEQLLAELGNIQQQQMLRTRSLQTDDGILPVMPAPELPNSNTKMSQHAIECVGVLFECILNDEQLPDSIKALLSHLHTPLLKVALLEPGFLTNTKHPARLFLNALIDAGERWVAPDSDVKNDVYPRMQALVNRVIVEFNDDTSLFQDLLTEFTEYLVKLEHKATLTEERNLQAAKGKEQLNERRAKVEAVIGEKLGEEQLPKPIVEMITGPWATFLAYILLRHGTDNRVWEDATGVIDDILWFIEPKVDNAEAMLAEKMKSSLYRRVEEGLASVGREPGDIQSCIRSLEMCKNLATENANQEQHAPQRTEDNSEQAVDQAGYIEKETGRDQMAAGSSQKPENSEQANTEALEKVSVKKVSGIELQKQRREAMQVPADLVEKVLQLDFGTWINWHKPNERKRQLKLTWYNINTQNCMLANQMGQQVAVVSALEIATGIRDGWIQVIEKQQKKPFFEKMLEIVADQLRSKAKTA